MTITNNNSMFLVTIPATKVSKPRKMVVQAIDSKSARSLAVNAMRQSLNMPGFSVFPTAVPHSFKPGDKLVPVLGV